MNMVLLMAGAVALLLIVVLIGSWLDAREAKRQNRKQTKGRVLVPDFTQERPR